MLHAIEPLLGFGFSDGEGKMPSAQTGVTIFFQKKLWATEPTRKESLEFFSGHLEVSPVMSGQTLFGSRISGHDVIEIIHQLIDDLGPADAPIKCAIVGDKLAEHLF